MVKQYKFLVKIPKVDNESDFNEYKFSTIEEVSNFLEISPNTIYSLRTHRLKFVHSNKKILQGVTIEKIKVFYPAKKDEDKIREEINEFRKRKSEM
jgi:hypothetical protein